MGLQTNIKVARLMHLTWPQGYIKVHYIRNGQNQQGPLAPHRATRWTYPFGYLSSMGRWVDWHIRGFWALTHLGALFGENCTDPVLKAAKYFVQQH